MIPIAFVSPNYPNEERVALLPCHISRLNSKGYEVQIENGFGRTLDIDDREYRDNGAIIKTRAECYCTNTIFNLKLTQPSDYKFLKENQTIIGWTHPTGSGADFYKKIACKKNLRIIDLDSVNPRIYNSNLVTDITEIPPHCFWENSYLAGRASIRLSQISDALSVDKNTKVAILGSGSVSQGAFYEISTLGIAPRMFYRRTLEIFLENIDMYDVIINGIEIDAPEGHIISERDLYRTKKDVLIIDAAADAGRSIYGTEYLTFENPIGLTAGRKYILVNNAPTLMKQEASNVISNILTSKIFPSIKDFIEK